MNPNEVVIRRIDNGFLISSIAPGEVYQIDEAVIADYPDGTLENAKGVKELLHIICDHLGITWSKHYEYDYKIKVIKRTEDGEEEEVE